MHGKSHAASRYGRLNGDMALEVLQKVAESNIALLEMLSVRVIIFEYILNVGDV